MARRRARAGSDEPTLFPAARAARAGEFVPGVVAGIDEAGLGPMLGPLAIGASAFRVPPRVRDLWTHLARAVARDVARDEARLVVADSKAVFTRTERGAERLEGTVLCFDALARGLAELAPSTRAFLEGTPERLRATGLAREPWYEHLPTRLAPRARHEDAHALLARAVADAGVEVAWLAARAVPASELNASFAVTDSKGATHWRATTPFLHEVWTRFGAEGVELVVDRHGGRMRYAALLESTFPRTDVTVVREEPARSEYRVEDGAERVMRVVFAEKAESLSFAVALASCAAKYAREACMEGFNAYFGALQPGLAPTAGYVTDARRWLVDAAVALERAGLDEAALVRTR